MRTPEPVRTSPLAAPCDDRSRDRGERGPVASGSMDPQPTDNQPPPSASPAGLETPTSPPTPSQTSSIPAGVDGLHVYTVSELQSARASGDLAGGPIALRGYWSYLGVPHSCGAPDSTPGELEIYCHDGEYGITERNEPAVILTKESRLVPAIGPMLTPWVPNEDWVLPLVSLLPVNGQPFPPVPIVVVGHLDDERAAECRPEQRPLSSASVRHRARGHLRAERRSDARSHPATYAIPLRFAAAPQPRPRGVRECRRRERLQLRGLDVR